MQFFFLNFAVTVKEVNCYIDFQIPSDKNFADLAKTYSYVADAKNLGQRRSDEFWLEVFPEYAIRRFYFAEGDVLPGFRAEGKVENKWHFYSLTNLLQNDYDIEYKELTRVTVNAGRLHYCPFGYPYGGVAGLITFIDVFNCEPTTIFDGTGVYKIEWNGTNNFKLKEINDRGQLVETKEKFEGIDLLRKFFKRISRKKYNT